VAGLIERFGVARSGAVLDLGAGTGKLTRMLVEHVETVIAVEPLPEMRRVLAAALPSVTVLDGVAEAVPLPDRSLDAVFVGAAFHWFRTEAAAREIARVLRPGGGLALLWNVTTWTDADTPWLGALREIVEPHIRGYPAGEDWQETLAGTRLFEELRQSEETHVQCVAPEDFLAQVASWSWIGALPEERRDALLAEVHALVRDQAEIAIPWRPDVYWTCAR
jgi:SAM-dependent methyltransferase